MATKDISDIEVCNAYEMSRISGAGLENWIKYETPEKFLMRQTGQCLKVCECAMIRACDRGYIEYGVTLCSGWLTDKGKELLFGKALRFEP